MSTERATSRPRFNLGLYHRAHHTAPSGYREWHFAAGLARWTVTGSWESAKADAGRYAAGLRYAGEIVVLP